MLTKLITDLNGSQLLPATKEEFLHFVPPLFCTNDISKIFNEKHRRRDEEIVVSSRHARDRERGSVARDAMRPGTRGRGVRLDSPAQQCWQPTNNVNHDVGRACRMQPLETREQTSERKSRIFPSPVVNRFLPVRTLPNELSDSHKRSTTRRTIFVEYRRPVEIVRCRSNVSRQREIKDKNFKSAFNYIC